MRYTRLDVAIGVASVQFQLQFSNKLAFVVVAVVISAAAAAAVVVDIVVAISSITSTICLLSNTLHKGIHDKAKCVYTHI